MGRACNTCAAPMNHYADAIVQLDHDNGVMISEVLDSNWWECENGHCEDEHGEVL